MAIAERASNGNGSSSGRCRRKPPELLAVVDPVPTLTAYISFYPHWNTGTLLEQNGFHSSLFHPLSGPLHLIQLNLFSLSPNNLSVGWGYKRAEDLSFRGSMVCSGVIFPTECPLEAEHERVPRGILCR
jgi:hypothetical protein